jgi:hypothetical protein
MSRSERIARKVFEECGIDNPTELPISEIILGRKAFYQEKPLIGKEGEIVSIGGRSIITINSKIEFESKKRFVSAHELGHYEMHRDLLPLVIDTEYDLINWYKAGQQETEANEFAAEFLMPHDLFYVECKSENFGPHIIDHLAKYFKVSKTAAMLKFVKAGNYPVMVVYCYDKRMKWWKKSDDFYYFLNFRHNENPPDGSIAYELFTTDNIYFDNERRQKIWKSTWFQLKPEENDKLIYEYCLYAKSYNYTLSILWED